MNALVGQKVRLSPKVRLDGVEPGEIGEIFDVEPTPVQTVAGPLVRVRFANACSGWLRSVQYEPVNRAQFLFRIPVTDGLKRQFMLVAAPDNVFAQMKAKYFCTGTRWQVLS